MCFGIFLPFCRICPSTLPLSSWHQVRAFNRGSVSVVPAGLLRNRNRASRRSVFCWCFFFSPFSSCRNPNERSISHHWNNDAIRWTNMMRHFWPIYRQDSPFLRYLVFASLSFVGNRQVQNDFTSLWMIVEEWIPTVIQSANFSANWFTCEGFLGPDGCVRRLGQIILQLWASLLDALAGWFSPNWFACEEFPQTGLLVAGFYAPQKHGRMAVLDTMAGWFARHVCSTCYCLCFFPISHSYTLHGVTFTCLGPMLACVVIWQCVVHLRFALPSSHFQACTTMILGLPWHPDRLPRFA